MKVLVAGWFSFVEGHATAGDLLVRDVVCQWLDQMELASDIALAAPFTGGVDWRRVDPNDYSHVLFICGPFRRSQLELEFLGRFAKCRLVGLNLSMMEATSAWNPFDLLLERDSSECVRPDMAFLSSPNSVPVVGICLVEPYPRSLVSAANDAIDRLVKSQPMAVVHIDTRLDALSDNLLRTPAEVESLIKRLDVLLTTRLHGLVLALKNGIPPLAIDANPGGAKVSRQAEMLGWPAIFHMESLDDATLQEAFQYCLTEAARSKARDCRLRAQDLLREPFHVFREELRGRGSMEERYHARLATADTLPSLEGKVRGSSRSWRHRLANGWMRVRRWLDITRT